VLLVLFGLIMVWSSTMLMAKEQYGDSAHFLKKQVAGVAIGAVIALIIVMLKYPFYLNHRLVFMATILIILTLVAVFFFGKINGSFRWIRIAGQSLQPSEFAKIVLVLYLASVLGRKDTDVNNLKRLATLLIPYFVALLLILREPDYGSFFLILTVTAIMLFVAGMKLRYFALGGAAIIPISVFMVLSNPERLNRILAFLHPEDYIKTYGFQATQSIFALGSGGLFGQGLGNSTQKLYFLPYAYTDFIYAIIGEETGLIGALIIMSFFVIIFIRGLSIAKYSGNRQAYLLVLGLVSLLVIQALINISVNLSVLPTKGIALPLISIGGSSMMASLILIGIVLNVSRQRKTVLLND
jgi:cell division protein FtsW